MNTFSKFLSTTGTLLATAGTLNAAPVNMTLPGHAGAVNALAVSADGSVIVSGSADGTAKVYDAQGGLTLLLGDGQNAVSAVAVAPDGSWAAMGNHDGRIEVRAISGESLASFQINRTKQGSNFKESRRKIIDLAVSPDGAYLAACTSDGALRVYSTSNWTAYDTETVTQLISALAFKADSSAIVAGTWDEILRNYSVSSKGFSGSNIAGHTGAVEDITLSPAGTTIAVTSEGEVWRWNGSTVLDHRALGRGWLNAVAAGAGSIAVGGQDNTVYMLSASDLTDAGSICGFEDDITALALTGDGSRLCIGTGQGEVWIYAMNGSDLKHFNGHFGAANDVAFSPRSRRLFSVAADGQLRVKALDSAEDTLVSLNTIVGSIAFAPDGTQFALGGDWGGEGIRLGRESNMDSLGELGVDGSGYDAVAFSPDGSLVAAAESAAGRIRFFNAQTRTQTGEIAYAGPATALFFVLDATELCVVGPSELAVYSTSSASKLRSMPLAFSPLTCSASADGLLAVIAGATDGSMLLVQTDDMGSANIGSGGATPIKAAAVSPDGERLAAIDANGTCHFFNTRDDGSTVQTKLAGVFANAMSFSADGSYVAIAFEDGSVSIVENPGHPRSDAVLNDIDVQQDWDWAFSTTLDWVYQRAHPWYYSTGFGDWLYITDPHDDGYWAWRTGNN